MFFRSCKFACRGIVHTYQTEGNFRVMSVFFILVVAAGIVFNITAGEWTAVLICCGMSLGAELLNTAVEAAIDLVVPTYHKRAAKAKDAASAGSFTIAAFSASVGMIVFYPYVRALFDMGQAS